MDSIIWKEMFKAAGFEPRIVELWDRNLTASAKSFDKHKIK